MSALQKLFKQTFIYGVATVMPRMLSFLLVRLHTDSNVLQTVADYGVVSKIYAWFVIFNVILAYGMETAFFRFYHKHKNKQDVVSTSAISLLISSVAFLVLGLLLKEPIAHLTNLKPEYIILVVWILMLDALVIIPFAWLRANEKPSRYAIVKILNVAVNLGLNVFFLIVLKKMAGESDFWQSVYTPNYEINYIFIANLIASATTLLFMLPFYLKVKYKFDRSLWKQMMRYAIPVLIAGIAFSINEAFDRILLDFILPKDISDTAIGMYSACYKLGLFMTLFATAYRLGIEPYFFSHANSENPQKNYAKIMEYFVVFGAVILLVVVVYADVLKVLFIGDEAYWEAMSIVPIILIANFCLGVYHNLSVWYKVTDRTKFGAYISVIGAVITLFLNFLLIPVISYKGSAIATLAAYGSMMLLSFFYGRKYYPVQYNLKKIGLYMGVSVTLSAVAFYPLDRNLYFGTLFVLLFLWMIYLQEKKELKKIFKRT